MNETPGGKISGRALHFFFLFDCSGSMDGLKIEALNFAVREAIPEMQSIAKQHPEAEILIRSIAFSDGARWLVSHPTPVNEFRWTDLQAGGLTDMGEALQLLAEQLDESRMPRRGLQPVIVLVSDGQPSDDFDHGLKALLAQGWGTKAVRIAIAIGDDADHSVLSRFIANPELPVLAARNPGHLMKYIRWTSTALVETLVKPPSQTPNNTTRTPVSSAMDTVTASTGEDIVW